MNRAKHTIGWCDWTWNPITGCKNNCSYCYARKIATRFKGTKAFPKGFEPTFHPERLEEPAKLKKPSKIFVCSMGEMFSNWIPDEWIGRILTTISENPKHIFQILTKFPRRAKVWVLPRNVWLGLTVDTADQIEELNDLLEANATVKFISFEPLLEEIDIDLKGIDWIIIGAQTNPIKLPKKEWVYKIIAEAKGQNIPVFIKDNLNWAIKIQEFPKRVNELNMGG